MSTCEVDRTSRPVTPPSARRSLSPGRRCLFIFIVLAGVFAFQEACFRFMFPLPEASFNRIHYMEKRARETLERAQPQADTWGISNVRIRVECEPDGLVSDHTLNLYGFRGPDFSLSPPRGRDRVLFVGDSFTEGHGVADEDTIPEQFARALGNAHPVEPVNLGIVGINFPEYLRILRDGVDLLHPHTVFLIVCWNDLPAHTLTAENAGAPPEYIRYSPYTPRVVSLIERLADKAAIPRRHSHSGPYPLVQPLPIAASQSVPEVRLDPEMGRLIDEGKVNPGLIYLGIGLKRPLGFDLSPEGGGVGDYLRLMAELCARQHARLVVVYIPFHAAVNTLYGDSIEKLLGGNYGSIADLARKCCRHERRHLAEASAAAGVPFLDTTGELIRAEKTRGRMFWAFDTHCNEDGYRLIADLCARYWTDGSLPAEEAEEPAGR